MNKSLQKPSPKNKPWYKTGFGLSILLSSFALSVAVVSSLSYLMSDHDTYPTTRTAQKHASKKVYHKGDTIKAGNFEFQVQDVKTTDVIDPDAGGYADHPDGTYVRVRLSVKNVSKSLETFSPDNVTLKWHDSVIERDDSIITRDELVYDVLRPGESDDAEYITFDVDDDAAVSKDLKLQIKAGFGEPLITVNLR